MDAFIAVSIIAYKRKTLNSAFKQAVCRRSSEEMA